MISRQARTPERSDDPLSRIAPLISWSVQHLDHLDDARALYDARVAADAIHRIRHDAPRGFPVAGTEPVTACVQRRRCLTRASRKRHLMQSGRWIFK